jgi:hypothetical protein
MGRALSLNNTTARGSPALTGIGQLLSHNRISRPWATALSHQTGWCHQAHDVVQRSERRFGLRAQQFASQASQTPLTVVLWLRLPWPLLANDSRKPSCACVSLFCISQCCQMMKEQAGGTCGSESIDVAETCLAMWIRRIERRRPR